MGRYRAVAHGMPSSFYIMTWHRPRGIRLQAPPLLNILLNKTPLHYTRCLSIKTPCSHVSHSACLCLKCKKIQINYLAPQLLVKSFECLSMTCTRPRLHFLAAVRGWPHPFHHVRAGQPLPKIVYEEDESLLRGKSAMYRHCALFPLKFCASKYKLFSVVLYPRGQLLANFYWHQNNTHFIIFYTRIRLCSRTWHRVEHIPSLTFL